MAFLVAWASYQAALNQLRDQVVKRGELLGTAINEAAKAVQSEDEIRFAVEEIVRKESGVYGITVATKDPMVIWASSFRPGTDHDELTQSMLLVLRQTLYDGVFGHFFDLDGDLITLVPLSFRVPHYVSDLKAGTSPMVNNRSTQRRSDIAYSTEYSWRTRITLDDDNYRGVIYLRFDWDSVKHASGNILWRSVVIMLAGIGLMGLLAYWLLYRAVLRPMSIIGDAIQRQKQGEQQVRVPELSDDEIGRLGRMFNHMLDSLFERDRRFRAIVDHLPIAVSLKDAHGCYHLTNRRYKKWFGTAHKEDNSVSESLSKPYNKQSSLRTERERQVVHSHEEITWEEECPMPYGDRRVLVTSLFPVFDVLGHLDAIGSASTDITDRNRSENELRQLSKAVESAGNGILIADARRPDFPIIYTNPAVEKLTGYSVHEFLGRNARFLHRDKHDQPGLDEIRAALRKGRNCRTILLNYRKDGTPFWNDFTLSPVHNTEGEVSHFIGIQSDVTKHKEAEERIQSLAYFDTLTKIPNRTLFHDRLQQALFHANRSKQQVGLLYLDLDNFKSVNDILGHSTGDRLLQGVTKRIVGCVRQWDTVARMGGDEFTVIVDKLLPDNSVRTLAGIAEKVMAVLSEPIMIDAHEIFITASIGIAFYPQDGDTVERLVKNADTAMYDSKSKGRDNYQFFMTELDIAARKRQHIEAQLRYALKLGEMTLNYQPQVDLCTGRTCGVEVLLRWTNHVLGVVQPGDFIPAAESIGVIVHMDEWVLRQACLCFREWQLKGLPLTRISVNLSPRQFRNADFIDRVNSILAESELNPTCLEFEVTESTVIHDPETAIDMLQDLKAVGARVAMDDFGTGYSSLRYLRQLPIDVVKIDKSFVRDIPSDPNDVKIVTAIIAMAHGLNMEVIAEGVETDAQLSLLKELGCDKAQGFLFSRPLPEKELISWVEGHRVKSQEQGVEDLVV